MIEYDHDTVNQHCVCQSDKLLTKVIIEKEAGGYIFFVIKYEKGQVPHQVPFHGQTGSAGQLSFRHVRCAAYTGKAHSCLVGHDRAADSGGVYRKGSGHLGQCGGAIFAGGWAETR